MSEYICFLITFAQLSEEWGNSLAKVAIKVHRDQLKHGVSVAEYPREYEAEILALVPLHARNLGPVVDIETIFEVEDPAMTNRYFTIIAIEDAIAGENRYYVKRPGSHKQLAVSDPQAHHLLRRLMREVPDDEEEDEEELVMGNCPACGRELEVGMTEDERRCRCGWETPL